MIQAKPVSRIGEEIIIQKSKTRKSTFENSILCIVVVERETPTLLVCRRVVGTSGDIEYRLDRGRAKNSPRDLAIAKKVLANERVEKTRQQDEEERRENDPREIMLRRLRNAGFEYEKLSTETIQQICNLLDGK